MMNNSLKHIGVLGMKWGVRRKSGTEGSSKSSKTPKSEEYIQTRGLIKTKKTSQLSNAELKKINERLQLEKQYRELNPTSIKRGMNKVKAITAAGTTVAALYGLSKTPLGQDIISKVKKAMEMRSVSENMKWVL